MAIVVIKSKCLIVFLDEVLMWALWRDPMERMEEAGSAANHQAGEGSRVIVSKWMGKAVANFPFQLLVRYRAFKLACMHHLANTVCLGYMRC